MATMPLFWYHIIAIPVFFTLLIVFKARTQRVKLLVLYIMCVLCILFYLINNYGLYIQGSHLLAILPLQLCNIGVFLVPYTLLTRKPLLQDFIFYLSVPGALAALLTPNADYADNPYALMTISFYIGHYIIVAVPLLLVPYFYSQSL